MIIFRVDSFMIKIIVVSFIIIFIIESLIIVS